MESSDNLNEHLLWLTGHILSLIHEDEEQFLGERNFPTSKKELILMV